MEIHASDINEAVQKVLEVLLYPQSKEQVQQISPRSFNCYEIQGPLIVSIAEPEKRMLLLNNRAANPFATMFETLWVFSGHNDIKSLEKYLPRVKDFSDDGVVWRAGYGPRLINRDFSQILYVYDCLKADPDSRRAVMTIWEPDNEILTHYHDGSKDYPCCDLMQFFIRQGKLNMNMYIRSNDVLWGFSGVNIFEWTFLQSLLANLLEVEVGTYNHIAGSMHYYDDEKVYKRSKLEEISNPRLYDWFTPQDLWVGDFGDVFKEIEISFRYGINSVDLKEDWKDIEDNNDIKSPILKDYCRAFDAWGHFQRLNFDDAIASVYSIKAVDIRIACFHYLIRQNRKWWKERFNKDHISMVTGDKSDEVFNSTIMVFLNEK